MRYWLAYPLNVTTSGALSIIAAIDGVACPAHRRIELLLHDPQLLATGLIWRGLTSSIPTMPAPRCWIIGPVAQW